MREALGERNFDIARLQGASKEIEFRTGLAPLLRCGKAEVKRLVVGNRFERAAGAFASFAAE